MESNKYDRWFDNKYIYVCQEHKHDNVNVSKSAIRNDFNNVLREIIQSPFNDKQTVLQQRDKLFQLYKFCKLLKNDAHSINFIFLLISL